MTPPNVLAELVWTTTLPTVSGDYFVAVGYGQYGAMHELIDVTDGVVSSLDSDYDRFVYEEGAGHQFFGPLEIPEPPVLTEPEESLANNPIDGEDPNV